jgi:hypothetical protein
MKKGDILICKEDFDLFEKDIEYQVLVVDNEQLHIMVTLSLGDKIKSIPFEIVNKKFKRK